MARSNHLGLLTLSTCFLLFGTVPVMAAEPAQSAPVSVQKDNGSGGTTGSVGNGPVNGSTGSLFIPGQLAAEDKEKETQEQISKAVAYVKEKGKSSALSEFNKKGGLFTKGSVYMFAIDYKGTMLADGYNQDLVGKNQYDLQDADGKYINRDMISKAQAGGGWELYLWTNPVTNLIECKKSFVQPMEGDYFIASGYYFTPKANGKCE